MQFRCGRGSFAGDNVGGPAAHGNGCRPYQALRLEGFALHPRQFRVAPEDEIGLSLQAVGERLAKTFVVGGFHDDELVGVGGLTRFEGAKLRHRALLWGMYVRERARGRGLADELVRNLLGEARSQGIAQVILTVAAEESARAGAV